MQINNIANNKLNKANSIGFQSSKLKTMLDSLKLKKQEKDSVELSEDKKQKKEKQKKFAKLMAIVGLVTSGAFLLMSVLRKRKLSTSDISKTFPSFDNSKLSTSDTSKTFASFDNSKLIENIPSSEDLLKSLDDDLSKIGLDLAFDEDKIAKDELREIVNKFLEKDVFIWKSKQDVVESICSDDRKIHFINLINGYNQKSSDGKIETSGCVNNILKKISDKNISKKDIDDVVRLAINELNTLKYTKKVYLGSAYFEDAKAYKKVAALNNYLAKNTLLRIKLGDYDFIKNINSQYDNFVEFLKTLKKGNAEYFYEFSKYDCGEAPNFLMTRKFYQSLKQSVIEKIDIRNLFEVLQVEEFNSKQASKILNDIPDETYEKMSQTYRSLDLASLVRFRDFLGVKNINELTMEQKRELLDKLVKNNASLFGTRTKNIVPIAPKNQEEYCTLLNKLAKSIGVDTQPITDKQRKIFEEGLNGFAHRIAHVDLDNVKLKMSFSREDFVNEVIQKTSGLSDLEKRKVMDYFGFEIKDGKLIGYPINVNNGQKIQEIESQETRSVVEEVRKTVSKYINPETNKIKFEGVDEKIEEDFNKILEEDFNKILEGLPELRSMIQKAQHGTHQYTLDIHTLKVFQNIINNPKFAQLSEQDKKILQISSLLHDITKAEGMRDAMHPINSSFDAYYIIQKLNLNEADQLKVYELIRTHNWLDRLNNPKNTPEMVESIAQDIAYDSRHSNTFELAKILCEADMKAVQKNDRFFNLHKKTLKEMSAKVDGYLEHLHKTQIVLPQTRIPKASQLNGATIKKANGIENKVIYMDDSTDFESLGFDKGTTYENWTALVHALDRQEQMSKFDTFSAIDTEALLSTSYINPKEYRVFRRQGVILDVNSNDIHAGYFQDFGTGYSKDIELLKQDYLFYGKRNVGGKISDDAWRDNREEFRTYIPNMIKTKAGLTDEEYMEKMQKIVNCSSITDIEKVDKDFADTLLSVFSEMHGGKRRGGRQYNEILVTRPKVQGVFAYDKKYEEIPEFLRKYAQDNDLPIIIFGKK